MSKQKNKLQIEEAINLLKSIQECLKEEQADVTIDIIEEEVSATICFYKNKKLATELEAISEKIRVINL